MAYTIAMDAPEKSDRGPEYFCRVEVNGDSKDVFGIDALQAILLGAHHIQNKLGELVKSGTDLYLSRDERQKIDIKLCLLCDFSEYLK